MRGTQYQLQQEIVDRARINVVTCGQCGDVFYHRLEEEELECPQCKFTSEPADFPDLYYQEQQINNY